ncbi:hypothetical protein [Schlesneria paludicola]|uniref:hypothetical protein n=1 Tax=Schlesneria paludicola TaxID=360056 RepID=UPI00029A9140|nr:hypothetical protein [Schlesneria paludicola]
MTKLTDSEYRAKLREILGNPVAKQMDELSRPILERSCIAIDEKTDGIVFEHGGFNGLRRAEKGEPSNEHGYREATNIECAELMINWCPPNAVVDLRKPLPQQIVVWLREIAAVSQECADAVEAIEDTRDLRAIRRIVATKVPATDAA